MMEDEFTGRETERQDCVDNAIANLIGDLMPSDCEFEWDIELIGEVRDALQYVLVDRLGAMSEMEFYPYREMKIETKELPFPKETIFVDEEEMSQAIENAIGFIDKEDVCALANDLLGGEVWIVPNGYAFVPNQFYGGAFKKT